ncbi:MAG: phage holin family protein, partial [Actinomycetota bacterium]|nr:phage holin family protein [Actinomycetota bacterium]
MVNGDQETGAGRGRIRSVRSPGQLFRHGALVVLLDALVLLALEVILPGFAMDGPASTIATALGVGLVNAFVWPVLSRLTLRLSVLTLGLFGLVLNALVVGLV